MKISSSIDFATQFGYRIFELYTHLNHVRIRSYAVKCTFDSSIFESYEHSLYSHWFIAQYRATLCSYKFSLSN